MTPPPRSLILGCGYLGLRLAHRLREAGHEVTGTARSGASVRALTEAGVRGERWDSAAPDARERLAGLAETADHVFFTAAPSGGAGYDEVYRGAAEHMAAVFRARLPEAAVFVSSSSVYGVADGSWVDEDTPAVPARAGGETLLAAEGILRRAAGPAVVVRSVGIYGPGRTPAERLRAGSPLPGTGDEWVNLVHVDDLAAIVAAASERGRRGGIYLAADGAPVSRREYYEEAARLVSAPPPRFAGGDAGVHFTGRGKRVRSLLVELELGVALRYPDYRAGLRASLG